MDLRAARAFTIDLSKEAGNIAKEFFTSQTFHKQAKGTNGDIVTQADLEIDEYIQKALSEKYPFAHIMSEETTSGDYRDLLKKDWVFIVDPLDGTINFSRNINHFGIAIGLMHKGTMQMSVANLPMRSETYWADADTDGAFLNEKAITTSPTTILDEMVVACDWSNNVLARERMVKIISNIVQKSRRIKCLGSPVADLCMVAKGDLDGYVHTRLRPWDITPAYIVQKAGGHVANFGQDDWNIFQLDIVASNAHLYNDLKKLIPYNSSSEIK
jgi:myo-inositol-1(or 4)-monophosphatase